MGGNSETQPPAVVQPTKVKTFLKLTHLMMQLTETKTHTQTQTRAKLNMPTFLGPNTQTHSEKLTILPLTHAFPTSPPGYLRWLSSRVPSSRAKERLHGSTFCF